MKDNPPQKLDAQAVRQGLLSIRSCQIQLLKELKSQTMQLQKSPIRFESSTQGSSPQDSTKTDLLAYSPQSMSNSYRFSLTPSHLPLQKPSSLAFTGEKEKQSSNSYLQQENKMLNDTLQKLLVSRSADKSRIRDLQSYLYFSQKMFEQITKQFINGSTDLQILKMLQHDLKMNRDIYAKYQDSTHFHLVELLRNRQNHHRQNGNKDNERERVLLEQNQELRQQLNLLQKRVHQKKDNRASLQVQNSRLSQQLEVAKKKCLQLQKEVERLNKDNKQLAVFWQKQNNERKALSSQLQKVRKELAKSDQKYEQIAKLQKDLANTQHQLKQKENTHANIQQNMKKLSEAILHYREENQKLKRQIKSIQQIRDNIRKEQQSLSKQTQHQLKTQMLHQAAMISNYEQEINDLRNHLASVKQHQQMMLQALNKQRQNELAAHQLYWKKVNAIKLNTTVDHLWQVKEMQYHNINQIFRSMQHKQPKT